MSFIHRNLPQLIALVALVLLAISTIMGMRK